MDVPDGFCWRCDVEATSSVKCPNCDVALYCSEKCKEVDRMGHATRECPMIAPKVCNFCQAKPADGKDTLMCSGCCAIWYCSKNCQRKHWKSEHKQKCEASKMIGHQMANNLRMDFRRKAYFQRCFKDISNDVGIETTTLPFALDLLRLQQNELSLNKNNVNYYRVLTVVGNFLASFLFSGASLPEDFAGNATFSQVEGNVSTAARDVLLLYIMTATEESFRPVSEIIPILWFSFRMTTEMQRYLNSVLTKITGMKLEAFTEGTRGRIVLEADDFVKIQEVWKRWRDAPCCIDSKGCIPLDRERKKALRRPGHLKGVEEYREFLPELHIPSVDQWFANGNFILPSEQTRVVLTHYNPLFVESDAPAPRFGRASPEPQSCKFALRCDWLPFKVFDYVTVTKAFTPTTVPISAVELVSTFVTKMVSRIERLFSEDQIQAKINIFANKTDFSLKALFDNAKFDRIFFSACVADAAGASRLLEDHKDLVNPDNPMAAVIVETTKWYSLNNDVRGLGEKDIIHGEEDHHFATTKYSTYLPEAYVISLQSMVAEFVNFLRAEHFAHGLSEESLFRATAARDLPKISEIFEKHGTWNLRDFRKKRNKVVPFMYRVHQRSMNNLTGRNRFLEFVLSNKK